jgi:hypothetical protein
MCFVKNHDREEPAKIHMYNVDAEMEARFGMTYLAIEISCTNHGITENRGMATDKHSLRLNKLVGCPALMKSHNKTLANLRGIPATMVPCFLESF